MAVVDLHEELNQGRFFTSPDRYAEWQVKVVDKRAVLLIRSSASCSISPSSVPAALRHPYKGMKAPWRASKFYLGMWHAIRDDVFAVLTRTSEMFDNRLLIVAGQGVGAAIAVLAHEDMLFHFPNVLLSTFAYNPPRVVSWAAPKAKWAGLVRVKDGTVVESPSVFAGYKHVGKVFRIPELATKVVMSPMPQVVKV